MIHFLIASIATALFFIVLLIYKNKSIKVNHADNIYKLQEIIISLHTKQLILNEKVSILDEYNIHYKKNIKQIGEEVVALQQLFINIINDIR